MVNIERLKIVRDFIIANPQKFDMRAYINECGTAMCIAGLTCYLFDNRFNLQQVLNPYDEDDKNSSNFSIHYNAEKLLGLNCLQSEDLFVRYARDNKYALINLNNFIKREEKNNG